MHLSTRLDHTRTIAVRSPALGPDHRRDGLGAGAQRRGLARRLAPLSLALPLLGGLAACGGDDGEAAGTPAASNDVNAFCDAWLQLDMTDTPGGPTDPSPEDVKAFAATVTPLFEIARQNAPAAAAGGVAALAPFVEQMTAGDLSGIETPAFATANESVEQTVRDECAVGTVDVKTEDYTFAMPETIPAGPVSVRVNNVGKEPHVLLFVKKPEGTTDNAEFIGRYLEGVFAGDPKAMAEFAEYNVSGGGPFAAPGGTGTKLTDFTPGEYLYFCPIPKGEGPDGQPHFTLGMMGEFSAEG